MRTLAVIMLLLILWQTTYNIVAIRNALAEAVQNKAGLAKLQKMLTAAPHTSVLNCYRGATEMVSAKYTINPFSKLNSFARGKKLIENAIATDSENIECRFLRYGLQRNLPVLLGYRDHLQADSLAIVKRLDTLKDLDLKLRILNFMKRK